jgi:hypothetical protein
MELSLSEQLLLLSYDEISGRPAIPARNLDYGLAAARLLDLSYAGALTITNGFLVPTGKGTDPVLAKFGNNRHSADWWVYHLADAGYRQDLLDRLVQRGLLDQRDHRVLGIFPVRAYPEVDPAQERMLADHLREVLTGNATPDQRSVSLLALTHACGLDKHLFPQVDRHTMLLRLGDLTASEWCGRAVRNIITSVNAAVISAVSGLPVSSAASAVPAT